MLKTFAASGGSIAGCKVMIDRLRFTLAAFVFSVGMSSALAQLSQLAPGFWNLV
jgi:7-keto-8-aminopelargonate synthetase-like enzyme